MLRRRKHQCPQQAQPPTGPTPNSRPVPVTEAGKQRSSQNSLNHGLTSQKVVLPGESQEDFDALQAGFLKSYAPAGEVEEAMVRNLAASAWRLERMQRVEAALFANRMGAIEKATGIAGVDALAAMFVDPAEMNRIRLFLRYMSETQRAYNKALRDIAVEQKARQQRNQKSPSASLARAGPVASTKKQPQTPPLPKWVRFVRAARRSLPKARLARLSPPPAHSMPVLTRLSRQYEACGFNSQLCGWLVRY